MTKLLHRFPDDSAHMIGACSRPISRTCFPSERALASLAENYVGLPF